jgi:hypothetical protein
MALAGCKACKVSMSGVNIPPDVKSFSVSYFENKAPLINPTLSQKFTETLKDKFLKNTNLTLIPSNGDYKIAGEITDYNIQPVASNANTGAQKNRFNMSVKIQFECPKHPELNFNNTFSHFQEFDASQSFQTVETALSEQVTEQIVQKIYNEIALKW